MLSLSFNFWGDTTRAVSRYQTVFYLNIIITVFHDLDNVANDDGDDDPAGEPVCDAEILLHCLLQWPGRRH